MFKTAKAALVSSVAALSVSATGMAATPAHADDTKVVVVKTPARLYTYSSNFGSYRAVQALPPKVRDANDASEDDDLDCAYTLSIEKSKGDGTWSTVASTTADYRNVPIWVIEPADFAIPIRLKDTQYADYIGTYRANFSGCTVTYTGSDQYGTTYPAYISPTVEVTADWLDSTGDTEVSLSKVRVKFRSWYGKFKNFVITANLDWSATNRWTVWLQRLNKGHWHSLEKIHYEDLPMTRTPKTHKYRVVFLDRGTSKVAAISNVFSVK